MLTIQCNTLHGHQDDTTLPRDLALKYHKSQEPLTGFSDADFAGDQDDRHSTSGNAFIFGNAVISWLSKKQPVVALSTTEAEYIALSLAAQDAIWLQKLLMELKVPPQPITLMEDNQGAIALTKNPVAHLRMKHINIRFHFVREALEKDVIKIKYILSN